MHYVCFNKMWHCLDLNSVHIITVVQAAQKISLDTELETVLALGISVQQGMAC